MRDQRIVIPYGAKHSRKAQQIDRTLSRSNNVSFSINILCMGQQKRMPKEASRLADHFVLFSQRLGRKEVRSIENDA
jgi:hypothetical protein